MRSGFVLKAFTSAITFSFVGAGTVLAIDNELEAQLHTAYLIADFGASTYKSGLLQQNDTGNTVEFAVGANVGAHKDLNIQISREMSPTTFVLGEGTVVSQWDETLIAYRLWLLHFGVVLASMKTTATNAGAPLFDATGTGYGGAAGFAYPLTRGSSVHLNVTAASISQLQEKDQKEVTFGQRMNADLGASVPITRRAFQFVSAIAT